MPMACLGFLCTKWLNKKLNHANNKFSDKKVVLNAI